MRKENNNLWRSNSDLEAGNNAIDNQRSNAGVPRCVHAICSTLLARVLAPDPGEATSGALCASLCRPANVVVQREGKEVLQELEALVQVITLLSFVDGKLEQPDLSKKLREKEA